MPQFDGESDPKEFLLKYEATIEAIGGGTTCKAKALVIVKMASHAIFQHNVLVIDIDNTTLGLI